MSPRKKTGVTVRVNADGTKSYDVRWRQGRGRDARNLSHSFSRERDAVDARNRILAAGSVCYCAKHCPPGYTPARGPGLPPGGETTGALTFGAYAERHIAAKSGVGEGYRRDMARDIRHHARPFLDRPLDEITRTDVSEWIVGMETGRHDWLSGPLSPATIRRLLAEAGAVMQAAQNDGLATKNPFRGHRLRRQVKTAEQGMTFLAPGEWKLLEAELPEGVYRDLAAFLIGSGLRWGEATALHVGDVDLLTTPARVQVRQAWKSDGKGGHELGPPKSARSRRTVPLSEWVRDLLIPHVAGKRDDELVFVTPRGARIQPNNFLKRVFAPAVERAQANGLEKRPRVHDLRHSWASWAIAAGVPMTEVSRRMGHSSSSITDQRYTHLLPSADAAFTAAMERYRTRPT